MTSEARQQQLRAAAEASHRGDQVRANAILADLLKGRPDDPELLFFRALYLARAGQAEAAIPFMKHAAAKVPDRPEIMMELAFITEEAGRKQEAERIMRRVVRRWPDVADAWIHLGNRAAMAGHHEEAAGHYERALAAEPDHSGALMNLAHTQLERGQLDAAAVTYAKAQAALPDHGPVENGLGLVRRRQGRKAEARNHFERAVALSQGRDATAHANLADLLREEGRYEAAIDHLRQALAIHPTPSVLSSLASLLERAHRLEEAEAAAGEALARHARQAEARLVLAKVARRRGRWSEAETAFAAIIAQAQSDEGPVPRAILARAQADLAGLREKAGRYEEAFALFEAANATNRGGEPHWQDQARRYRADIDALADLLAQQPARREMMPPGGLSGPAPIFLIGFPRSGTTLMDQLLAGHSALFVMEEKTLLDRLAHRLGENPAARLERLASLSAPARQALRQDYFAMAKAEGGFEPAGEGLRLVDKLPLNGLNLWLIHRLFPEAKILFALRDPRDVVISCFANLFRLGDGLAGFPSLQETVALYASVMRVVQRSRARWPFDLHELRYEALLADLESEVKALFTFLDLPWEARVLDHRKTAAARAIVTPSYHQVVQPLYRHAEGRWVHFQDQLTPFEATLAPFLDAFGYRSAP